MIIVSGDSFTDLNYVSQPHPEYDTGYKKWSSYIKNSEHRIVNIGTSGWDNVSIINGAIEELFKSQEPVYKIVIALTNWYRFALPHAVVNPDWAYYFKTPEGAEQMNNTPYMQWLRTQSTYFKENYDFHTEYCKKYSWHVDNDAIINYSSNQTLFHIIKLYEICKAKNVKLDVFQMLQPIVPRKETSYNFTNALLKNEWFKKLDKLNSTIDKNNFNLIGWPFFENIGGTCAKSLLNIEHKISHLDEHPNEKGHMVIGAWYNEHSKI